MAITDPNSVQSIITNLISEDNENLATLRRQIKDLESSLDSNNTTLKDVQLALAELQSKLGLIKEKSKKFSKGMKLILEEDYNDFFAALELNRDYKKDMDIIDNAVQDHSQQLEEEIARLSGQLEVLISEVTKLETSLAKAEDNYQMELELQGILKEYISNKSLELTKSEIIEFLKGFKDLNGELLFKDDMLPVAAQMVMFAENFKFDSEVKKSIGETLKKAYEEAEKEEPALESDYDVPITDIPGLGVNIDNEEQPVAEEPTAARVEESVPTGTIEGSFDIYPTSELDPDLKDITLEETGLPSDLVKPSEPEIDPNLTNLLESLAGEGLAPISENNGSKAKDYLVNNGVAIADINSIAEYYEQEKLDNFIRNYHYLKSIGITGNFRKSPVTLYWIPNEKLIPYLEEARVYQYPIKNVQDIIAFLKARKKTEVLDEAITETFTQPDEYPGQSYGGI